MYKGSDDNDDGVGAGAANTGATKKMANNGGAIITSRGTYVSAADCRAQAASAAQATCAGEAKGDEPKMWPSERIPQGGLFHTPKVQYSKETADLIRLLMKESKMTMLMRKQINYHLRNNEPLPKPLSPRINTNEDPDQNAVEILKRARNAKRKSLDKIIASGAYEMPNYRPRPDGRIPSDKAKRQLQEIMAGMRLPETTLKPKRRSPKVEIDASPAAMINERKLKLPFKYGNLFIQLIRTCWIKSMSVPNGWLRWRNSAKATATAMKCVNKLHSVCAK